MRIIVASSETELDEEGRIVGGPLAGELPDYVCDGVDDQVEIQAAIDQAAALGLQPHLEGRFHRRAAGD